MALHDYPKMLYKKDGVENIVHLQDGFYSSRIVDDEDDEAAAVADGFEPYAGAQVAAPAKKGASGAPPKAPAPWGKG